MQDVAYFRVILQINTNMYNYSNTHTAHTNGYDFEESLHFIYQVIHPQHAYAHMHKHLYSNKYIYTCIYASGTITHQTLITPRSVIQNSQRINSFVVFCVLNGKLICVLC